MLFSSIYITVHHASLLFGGFRYFSLLFERTFMETADSLIINLFIFICNLYLFGKILNAKTRLSVRCFIELAVYAAVFLIILLADIPAWCDIIWIIVACTAANSLNHKYNFHFTLFVTILSLVILLGIYSFFVVLVGLLYGLLGSGKSPFATLLFSCLTVILCSASFVMLFRIKRLSRGMTFLHPDEHIQMHWLLSIIMIAAFILTKIFSENNYIMLIGIFARILLLIEIINWWRDSLRLSYINSRFVHDTHILESELARVGNDLTKANEDISYLSKIVHRDNKLIPSMLLAVEQCISDHDENTAASLIRQLNDISKERGNIVGSLNISNNATVTNNIRTDAIINYYTAKAQKENVLFTHAILPEYSDTVSRYISDLDICTILADLLENAFYAVRMVDKAQVMLQISQAFDVLKITVYDNGVPFPAQIIKSFGAKRITTHEHDGGSGIGLVTICNLVRQNNGNVSVNQNLSDSPYTKSVDIEICADTIS